MTLAERLRLVSPFRWRLEWAVLLAAAVAGALTEQAREARLRDPYQIVASGHAGKATVTSARTQIVALGTRRGSPVEETRTSLDLEWEDAAGTQRRVTGYRLDPETIAALRIDVAAGRWPPRVDILYLDRSAAEPGAALVSVVEQGITASAFQRDCRPRERCRLLVLAPEVLVPAEIAAANVDYVLDRAPHAFKLCLFIFSIMLVLRLVGIVHNRPSLE